MSHASSIFQRVPVEMPNRSGFDMSHENLGTLTTGTLVPVLVDEILPNDSISLGSSFQVQLPPMVADFYGRVDFVLEAFFVPMRLLWGGFQDFMTHPTAYPQFPSGTPVQGKPKYLPRISFTANDSALASGSLGDYLGFKGGSSTQAFFVNALPFLAYHRIYDDWYRESRIQSPCFYRPQMPNESPSAAYYLPYVSVWAGSADNPITLGATSALGDGVYITSLRQRNFAKDYFTTATPLPQAGNASQLEFDTDNQTGKGAFSIAALRAANSLQKWMERNNIAGYRYSDQIYAQFGRYPSDAIMDRVIYLGRQTSNVYTRSVFNTNGADSGDTNNSLQLGYKAGSSQAIGEGSLVDNFTASEHGYLFVLASLVPHAYYSSGVRRYLKRSVVGDFAFPLLSGMGDQAIMTSELDSSVFGTEQDLEFGYNDLYSEYKYHDDEVHGLLRDGSSLDYFSLQRSFTGVSPELSSDFLEIPVTYLDQVTAVATEQTGYTAWYDIFFPYKKVSTLPEYSLPTLADLKHVHTEYMSRGGKRL